MADPIRIDLSGELSGHHLMVDPDALTFGLLEDMESNKASTILDGIAAAIVGGDLPKGTDREGLRRLRPGQMKAVIEGVAGAFAVPKS